jgi:hypothetical protein
MIRNVNSDSSATASVSITAYLASNAWTDITTSAAETVRAVFTDTAVSTARTALWMLLVLL